MLRRCMCHVTDGLLDIEALRGARVSDDGGAQTVDEAIAEVAGSVRENIQLRRAYRHALALASHHRAVNACACHVTPDGQPIRQSP